MNHHHSDLPEASSNRTNGHWMAQTIQEVDVDAICENHKQPRTHFDEQALIELSESIREHGLIQPLIVTAQTPGSYELIAGERRWRAARQAGLQRVPVIVKDVTPQQLLELALVENVQRADLNPMEEGQAYQTLKDEFGLTDEEIARRVGKNRVTVVNARRLLKLIPEGQQALVAGSISAGHGRALLRLEQPAQQAAVLRLVQYSDLSVREAERLCDLVQDQRVSTAVQQALLQGTISVLHAQILGRVTDPVRQDRLLNTVIGRGLGVRELEHLCADAVDDATLGQSEHEVVALPPGHSAPTGAPSSSLGEAPAPTAHDPEDIAAQRMFEEALGTPVQLVRGNKTIKLTITLYSDEQLQGFYDLIASNG